MAGSAPVPFEGVSVLFYFSGNSYLSARIVHLTGEHFGIITTQKKNMDKDKDLEKMFAYWSQLNPRKEEKKKMIRDLLATITQTKVKINFNMR